jgi:hypothetical protein
MLKCSRLKNKLVTTFLSRTFQIKTRMLRINLLTHVQCFQLASLYTNSLDSLYLFVVRLFSHILFSVLENPVSRKYVTNVAAITVK